MQEGQFPACKKAIIAAWGDGYLTHEQRDDILLELQRLEAIADAAQAVRKVASITGYHGTEADRFDYTIEMDMSAQAWEALADALNVLDKGREVPEMECGDSPWATGPSNSCPDYPYYHPPDGFYDFPSPDVSAKVEPKEPIRIVPLKQGFVVAGDEFEGLCEDDLAFTDAVDLAEWLLEWLGLEHEPEALSSEWWERDRAWRSHEHKRALDVVEAADTFIARSGSVTEYHKLVEAVKKWRIVNEADGANYDELVNRAARLDARGQEQLYKMQEVAEAAQVFVETAEPTDFDKLAEAVDKWRPNDHEEVADVPEQIATGHL